ncbi:hypothetical protein ANN_15406 [Periplaneta americana]|uniref:Uncharacterized protein n=1 Tax=Periplaneta americana TaxID=6978 RepID=A0ABQ8SGB1_PERAM|nr:hypothetical protein ANN_15406 [Periplaneta americana]
MRAYVKMTMLVVLRCVRQDNYLSIIPLLGADTDWDCLRTQSALVGPLYYLKWNDNEERSQEGVEWKNEAKNILQFEASRKERRREGEDKEKEKGKEKEAEEKKEKGKKREVRKKRREKERKERKERKGKERKGKERKGDGREG